jgi:hypothetical protein
VAGAIVGRLRLRLRPAFSGSLRRSTLGTIVTGTIVVGPLDSRALDISLALFRRPGSTLGTLSVHLLQPLLASLTILIFLPLSLLLLLGSLLTKHLHPLLLLRAFLL